MKLKQRVEDFRVRELLEPGVVVARGEWRVYRVVKRKLTSLQAAEVIASEARCPAGEVTMCGLKDRQGVTVQHMAVRHGPELVLAGTDMRVETIGFSAEPLDSKASLGNAFEIVVRGLSKPEVATLRANVPRVRDQGVLNYFDDQRFGNLRHGQGWIALDLMRGEPEVALKKVIASRSFHDDERTKVLKQALRSNWGDWSTCRDIAGKFGAYHSVFEHLKKKPTDFAGAFYHISSRVRLIHLYAYQSHLWNRAVVGLVRERTQPDQRLVVECDEGALDYPVDNALLKVPDGATFTLPGPALEGATDAEQRALLADALAADRLVPARFKIEGVSGFRLKAEERALIVVPQHLRVRPPRPDPLNRGLGLVEVRFDLPRGAYATLVVRRLLATPGGPPSLDRPRQERGELPPRFARRPRDAGDPSAPRDRRERFSRDERREPRERFGGRAPRREPRPKKFRRGPPRERGS